MIELGEPGVCCLCRIVLTPNRALSRRQLTLLICATALVMFGIALAVGLIGLWMILPFYGFEWLLLTYCLILNYKFSSIREVITITDEMVKLETGSQWPEQTYEFQRPWVALQIKQSQWRGYPSHLLLSLRGREVEVGSFLVESERQQLARRLREFMPARMVSI